jgi:dihydrofolate reductase
MRDFAELWRAADKIVYSRSLESASSARTRVERHFDAAAVRQLKETAQSDLGIGGAELAGQAIEAGLVDECHLIVVPVLVGGGKRAFPAGVRANLELLDKRSFAGGAVYLRYKLLD